MTDPRRWWTGWWSVVEIYMWVVTIGLALNAVVYATYALYLLTKMRGDV